MNPSPADITRLKQLSDRIAAAQATPWQPSVVVQTVMGRVHTIAGRWHRGPLTMEKWLDLDEIRSPFISRQFADDPSERAAEVLMTLRVLVEKEIETTAFFKDCAAHNEELARVIADIDGLFAEADSTIVAMKMDGVKDSMYRHGFGWWAILYGFLCERFGRLGALATTVQEAWMLYALHLNAHGFKVQGASYEQRDWSLAPDGASDAMQSMDSIQSTLINSTASTESIASVESNPPRRKARPTKKLKRNG